MPPIPASIRNTRPSSKRTSDMDEAKRQETRRSVRLKVKTERASMKVNSTREVATSSVREQKNSIQKKKERREKLHQVRPERSKRATNSNKDEKKGTEILKITPKDRHVHASTSRRKKLKGSKGMFEKQKGCRRTGVRMKATHIRTFSGEKPDDSEKTRFCDVAFIDDEHVLVLDDKYFMWQAYGCRICCFRLDGTLLAESLLPGYPWSVIVLSPREAVVTIRDSPSKGLVWLRIDINNKSIEVARNVVFENTLGITYDGDRFIASHFQKDYMTILDTKGKIVGKVPVESGRTFRCLSLDVEEILYSDFEHHKVNAIDRKGKIVFSLQKDTLRKPSALAKDDKGNLYIGNAGDLGASNVLQFDRTGKYVATLCTLEDLHGLDVNNRSDMLAVSHENFISLYNLTHK